MISLRRRRALAGPSAPEVPGLLLGAPLAPSVPGRPSAWWAVDDEGRDVLVQRVRPASGTAVPLAALDEASRRRALPHPHLLPLLGVVRCREGAVQVLGPAPGGSLAELLAGAGPLPASQVVTLVAGLGSALAALHEEGLVHGELCAEGVLLDARGMPVLLGWGAARPAPAGRAEVRRRELRVAAAAAPTAPVPSDDVLALARLGLEALGPGGPPDDEAASHLRGLLVTAAAAAPAARPSAGALASACWEVAPAAAVDVRSALGGGSGGSGAARAEAGGAGLEQTRTVRLRPRGAAAADVPAPTGRAVRRGRWRARWARRPGRWALLPLAGAVLLVVVAAAATVETGPSAPPTAPAQGVSKVSVRQPARDERLTGADPTTAVGALSELRVAAITAGDPTLLAAVDVPSSPAALRDRQLLASLAGREVEGLRVDVLSAQVRAQTPTGTWVEVVSAASAHRVVTADGAQDVAAGAPVTSRLLLRRDAGAWKVADVA